MYRFNRYLVCSVGVMYDSSEKHAVNSYRLFYRGTHRTNRELQHEVQQLSPEGLLRIHLQPNSYKVGAQDEAAFTQQEQTAQIRYKSDFLRILTEETDFYGFKYVL